MGLFRYVFMEAYDYYTFKSNTVLNFHIVRDTRYAETSMSGTGDNHTHLGVEIVV